MSFRNVMKDGWHPKGKEGGKESWRGDFKGINQVVSQNHLEAVASGKFLPAEINEPL